MESVLAPRAVALNVDLGELADEPEDLYRLATVVNVACGGHAGDAASMARAIALARASGAEIAAHPSYPDRAGFGRTSMALSPAALEEAIAEQCAALQTIATGVAAAGVMAGPHVAAERRVRAVKLHGALYHDAAKDPAIAAAVMSGASRGLGIQDVTWIGPARGELRERARAAGLAYVREGFADRGVLPDGSLVPRGRPGALVEEPERAAAQALALARAGIVDTLCVHSDTPNAVAIARAVRAALDAEGLLRAAERGCTHVIDVVYDGPDLGVVAAALGVATEEVVALHAGREYTVEIVGFLPGFAYMGPLDRRLVVPRRPAPRPRVPAQSVAIAGAFTGIYPLASPGGWSLLGRSLGPPPFDPARAEPFLFAAGDRVRFRPVDAPPVGLVKNGWEPNESPGALGRRRGGASASPADAWEPNESPGALGKRRGASASPADAWEPNESTGARGGAVRERAALVVAKAAGVATIQDEGRGAWLSRGMPPSGPLDPETFSAANRAVGNAPGAAAIELLVGSLVLRARGALVVSIDGDAPVRLQDGEELRVAEGPFAVRYVALGGGADVPVVLGSRATLLSAKLGGIEGRALRRGDALEVGAHESAGGPAARRDATDGRGDAPETRSRGSGLDARPAAPPRNLMKVEGPTNVERRGAVPGGGGVAEAAAGDGVVVEVEAGPHVERFPAGALDALLSCEWRVSRLSDRTGARLEGGAIPRSGPDLAAPTPMRRGCVQVTTDGTPIVLGPDHPTTGGYPVLAVVRATSFGALARKRAGEVVRFRLARVQGLRDR